MNLQELQNAGGIVSEKPVKQEITWKRVNDDGEEETLTFDVHVVRLAYGDYEQLFIPPARDEKEDESDDDDQKEKKKVTAAVRRSVQAELISLAIRLGDKANERLTYEQAYRLQPGLASAFIKAINKVNGKAKKKSDGDGRAVARAGTERDRREDDRRGEGDPVVGGSSAVAGVLQEAGNAEHQPEAGVGSGDGGSAS